MLFECDKTTSENIYKLLVSTVVPRPIAWVTTQDVDGTVNAAPFSFFNAVSGNPPVVVFGIGGRGPGGQVLHRHAKPRPDWSHARERMVRAHDGPVRNASDRRGRLAGSCKSCGMIQLS